ncbi:MAG: S-layer homology domain-containing protein, partial [Oscillospiraceae bacterium]|nr:S-layer homology domain-containing protein [Oscillospiraceae bacterium]
FDDVVPEDWFYDYVMELSEEGVVGGRGNGGFDPGASVTVGEALKLVLLAAGAGEQAPVQGHWASGYASLMRALAPFSDGLLDDLDAHISRIGAARLAVTALGFGQSFSDTPFDDVDDSYVTALAELGVITGSQENGKTLIYPDRDLTRAEISAIVWRVRNAACIGTTQTVRYGSRVLEVMRGVPLNRYSKSDFSGYGKEMTYTESGVTVLRGIDVSRFQGDIDWNAVSEDGIDFAMLRVGGRYWGSGDIYDDQLFDAYYTGAEASGLKLGYYFYSQAVSVEEAIEEADYVIEKLLGRRVDAPVVFDWETAGASDARTNGLPVSTVCDCAVAFCERIRAAGYSPMIYMNTHDGYIKYDLSRLSEYSIWYAGQYNGEYPRFVYDFQMWQYTSSGSVNGVNGNVDMDLWFIR